MTAMRYGILALLYAAASTLAIAQRIAGPEGDKAAGACDHNVCVPSLARAGHAVLRAVGNHRLLIVGEIHGTNEAPDLVASMVGEAAGHRPVRVGLEMPAQEQAPLQTYLRSAGTADDRQRFLATPFWTSSDGRSSTAMLRLIDTLRLRRVAGDDIDLFAMEPVYPNAALVERAGGFLPFKESGMANAIKHALGDGDRALVIALMGNFHARYGKAYPFAEAPPDSVSEQLASDAPYVLLPFARHTEAWNCMSDGCGVHSSTSTHAPTDPLPRLDDIDQAGGPIVAKLWLASMTAAAPANPVVAANAPVESAPSVR